VVADLKPNPPEEPKKIEPTFPISVEAVLENLDKKYGKGTCWAGIENNSIAEVEFFPSGCLSLDTILGGGIGRGRIVEVLGPEAVGKTSILLHSIASAQKHIPDKSCAFVDAEHALDRNYAKALGVNLSTLLVSQPDYGEQALEIVDMFVRSNGCSLIVVDSVAALVPKAELDGEMLDNHVGLHARLMSQAMRKLTGIVQKSKTTVMFANQLRSNIASFGYGPKDVGTGGNALKYYASQRIDIRRIGAEKVGDKIVGNKTKIKVVKNRLAPPFRECEVLISYGKGINRYAELVELGTKYKFVEKSGAWFKYNDEAWHGKASALTGLEANQELSKKLEAEIKETLKKRGGIL
jgi:recombination protein RecA